MSLETGAGARRGEERLAPHTRGTRERDAHYTARRDLSEADRYDYTTVVKFGRQTAAERRAVSQEKRRSRDLARAKRTASRDP